MKITKDDFYVGQELLLQQSNKRMGELIKANVHSIGRKYIYLGRNNKGYVIHLDSTLDKRLYGKRDRSVRGRFFFNKDDYDRCVDLHMMKLYIQSHIYEATHLSIDELKQIERLIKGE